MTTLSGTLGGLFGRRSAGKGNSETDAHELPQNGKTSDQINEKPDQKANPETATQSTTGGRFENGPVVVWQAPNKMEAEIVKGRLESVGIPAFMRGEALGPIIGLTSGSLALTEVLVPYPLADKAMDLLYGSEEADAEAADAESANLTGDSHGTDQ